MKKDTLKIFEIIFIILAIITLLNANTRIISFIFIALYLLIQYLKRLDSNITTIPSSTPNNGEMAIDKMYEPKKFLTPYELNFYKTLKELEIYGLIIIPQVNLATVVNKKNAKHRSELFRNIDFGIFDQDFNLKLLIELNDKTHNTYKRRDRDLKVKAILNSCGIPLMNFLTSYPNEKHYVINRILNELNIDNTKKLDN